MDEQDLLALPVHGPNGRIAAVRREMGLRQQDFAEAVGTSRETVSHWENVDENGQPRQRTTRRSSARIADIVRQRLGLDVSDRVFSGYGDTPIEAMWRELETISTNVARLTQGDATGEVAGADRLSQPELTEIRRQLNAITDNVAKLADRVDVLTNFALRVEARL
jgi:DNA-binding XRE family transcriptional regulator